MKIKFISIILFSIFLITLVIFIIDKPFNKTFQDDQYVMNSINNKLIFSLPIKSGEEFVAYSDKVIEMERFGPESFAVSNDSTFYILDNIDKQVEIYNLSGKSKGTINLPKDESYLDIELRDNGYIVVLTYNGTLLEYNNHFNLINEKRVVIDYGSSLYKNKNNDIVIRDIIDETETNIDTKEISNKYDFIDKKSNKNNSNQLIYSYQGHDMLINFNYESSGTYPLKHTNDNEILISINESLVGKEIYVENRINKYKKGKKLSMALAEPTVNYEIIPHKFIYATKSGCVYQMVCNKNSVDIYELVFTDYNRTNIDK